MHCHILRAVVTIKFILLLPILVLAACTPQLQEIGPPIAAPVLQEKALVTADNVKLPLRTWRPKSPKGEFLPIKGVIIALHGFNDHALGMEVPGAGMARRGFAVYAYDQRGFGNTPQRGIWPGEAQLADDLRMSVALLKQHHPEMPIYVMGESMGAAVAMLAATQPQGLDVDGLILVSPATWGWETLSPFYRSVLEASAHIIPRVTITLTTLRVRASNNTSALRKMARDPGVIKATRVDAAYGLVNLMSAAYQAAPKLCRSSEEMPPCLIAYGGREDILDGGAIADTIKRYPKLPPNELRLAIYRNGHHLLLRDLESRKTFDDVAAWIADKSTPLPSGADHQY